MISNFHTHTYRCKHASGDIEDYVNQAKIDGCSGLGFSDHTPYPPDTMDNWSGVRMTKEQSYEYVNRIHEVAKSTEFPLFTGFECEWSPRYKTWYKDFLLGELGVDYLAFGPHWVEHNNEFAYLPEHGNKELLHKYIDSMIQAMETKYFSFVAHPDIAMMAWKEWDDEAKSCFSSVIDCAVSLDIPLEINGHGLHKGTIQTQNGIRYNYPYKEFWELAKSKNAKVICNSDAHDNKNVIKDALEAREFAKEMGIEVYDFLLRMKK